ncbi:MAG TPA: ATP-binding protein [Pirellulales bacterium]
MPPNLKTRELAAIVDSALDCIVTIDAQGKVVQVDHALEKAQGGLGIGLTLAKQLADLHGGGIEARSDGPGKGAEFIVRLPLAAGNT